MMGMNIVDLIQTGAFGIMGFSFIWIITKYLPQKDKDFLAEIDKLRQSQIDVENKDHEVIKEMIREMHTQTLQELQHTSSILDRLILVVATERGCSIQEAMKLREAITQPLKEVQIER